MMKSKSYRNKYYLAEFKGNCTTHNIQLSEISKLSWFTYEEAIKNIKWNDFTYK